jgi:SPP1 gp7 family putative phage head morphogenesis protein
VIWTPHIVRRAAHAQRHGLASPRTKPARYRPPTLIESDYAARLVGVVDKMRAAAHHLTDALPQLLRHDVRTDEHPGQQARTLMDRVRHDVEQAAPDSHVEHLAGEFARRVSLHQGAQLQQQAKAALGIEAPTVDRTIPSVIQGFVHENVSLVRKLKGSALDNLETIITRAVANNASIDDVAKEISDRFGMADRHARLIAEDQIARVDSAISEARHRELGISRFYWTSMRDSLVRPEHDTLDNGRPYSYDNPPAEGLPGRARRPRCRCVAVPVWEDLQNAIGQEDGETRQDDHGYNPYRSHGKFAPGPHKARPAKAAAEGGARGMVVGEKFNDAAHRKVILQHKLAEAHHRNESIRLGFQMKALRDQARTASHEHKAGYKAMHEDMKVEREHHRWAASKARAERLQASKDLAIAKVTHREAQVAKHAAEQERGGIGIGRVHGEHDHPVIEGHESPAFSFTPHGGRIAGEGDHATIAQHKPAPEARQPSSAEQLAERATKARAARGQEHGAGPAHGPRMSPEARVKHEAQQRQAENQRARSEAEARRPVQTPHGYTVEENWPGIKTYVSPQGNRYTEYDVKRGTLDRPASPEDFPAARVVSLPAPKRPGFVARVKQALGRG